MRPAPPPRRRPRQRRRQRRSARDRALGAAPPRRKALAVAQQGGRHPGRPVPRGLGTELRVRGQRGDRSDRRSGCRARAGAAVGERRRARATRARASTASTPAARRSCARRRAPSASTRRASSLLPAARATPTPTPPPSSPPSPMDSPSPRSRLMRARVKRRAAAHLPPAPLRETLLTTQTSSLVCANSRRP